MFTTYYSFKITLLGQITAENPNWSGPFPKAARGGALCDRHVATANHTILFLLDGQSRGVRVFDNLTVRASRLILMVNKYRRFRNQKRALNYCLSAIKRQSINVRTAGKR